MRKSFVIIRLRITNHQFVSYNVNNNVGSSKYVINFHNGIKKHNDGSNFYDIKTFKNIPDLNKCKLTF